jgi:hypothetical protein
MVVETGSRIRAKSLKLLGTPDFAAGPPDQKLADLARAQAASRPFRRTIRVSIRAGKLRSDLEHKIARSRAEPGREPLQGAHKLFCKYSNT